VVWLAALFQLWALGACGSQIATTAKPITLYTCVNDTTIQPVIQKFEAAHAGVKVDLFREPTGQLNARVASDVRSGGLKADVVWACDPLTMQDYVDQGLVGGWTPQTDIPATVRTPDYVGVAVLYMVAVTRTGRPGPAPGPNSPAPARSPCPIQRLRLRRSARWVTSGPTSTPISRLRARSR